MESPNQNNQEQELNYQQHYNTSRPHYESPVAEDQRLSPEQQLNRSMDDVDLDEDNSDSRKQTITDEYGGEYDDEIDSNYFQHNNTSERYAASARRSSYPQRLSNASQSDYQGDPLTEQEQQALKRMKIQNITSLVNIPRQDTFLKKIGKLVKENIMRKPKHQSAKKAYQYKSQTEKEITESFNIPKVASTDFAMHLQKTRRNAYTYEKNQHQDEMKRISRVSLQQQNQNTSNESPFEMASGVKNNQTNTSRSGPQSSGRSNASLKQKYLSIEATSLPPQFCDESYQFDRSLLKITSSSDLLKQKAKFEKYLEIVNSELEKAISGNKTFFGSAFNNIESIKQNNLEVSLRTRSIQRCTRNLKVFQLKNMIQLYRLQRKKLNIARTAELLKYITVLKQSLPVIDNLIKDSDTVQNFQVGLDLIRNANELIQHKLNGIDCVANAYKIGLDGLRAQCIQKIEDKGIEVVRWYLEGWISRRGEQTLEEQAKNQQQPFTLELFNDVFMYEPKVIDAQTGTSLQVILRDSNSIEEKYPHIIAAILDFWVFTDISNIKNEEGGWKHQWMNEKIQQLQSCVLSILKCEDTLLAGSQSSEPTQLTNASLDNMILSLKNAHTSALKSNNNEAILKFLMNKLLKIMGDPSAQKCMKTLSSSLLANCNNDQAYKQVFKHIQSAMKTLSNTSTYDDFMGFQVVASSEASRQQTQDKYDEYFRIKDEIFQLFITGFLVQAMIGVQMARALQGIEDMVIGALLEWQKVQKESQIYLLMPTKDQKSILLHHDRSQKRIRTEFNDSKDKLKANVQRKMDKWLKEFNYESIENKSQTGLLQVLMSSIRDTSSVTKDKSEWENMLQQEQLNTFYELNNVFTVISRYMAGGESLNPLKIPLKNFDVQLEELQKQFIMDYQVYHTAALKHFVDEKEKYVQHKGIQREDEEEFLATILQFSGNELAKNQESIEFGNKQADSRSYPSNTLLVERKEDGKVVYTQAYKLFASQLEFNRVLAELVQIVKFKLPSKQIKMYEGSKRIIELIKAYNAHIKNQVLGCGAYYKKKVESITAKHLAYSLNCVRLMYVELMPSLRPGLLLTPDKGHNIRKLITNDTNEVERELLEHIQEVYQKLTSIMVDTVQPEILKSVKGVDWDKNISKGSLIEPSRHIVIINTTLNQMFKVLRTNLSMPQSQIEQEIMQNALEQIISQLEQLYIEQTSLMTSKYAKKRIKVDMKVFLKNCDDDKQMKFTKAFKQTHFNLLIQEDSEVIMQAIEKEQTLSSSHSISPHSSDVDSQSNAADLSKITVLDPYSKIKQSIKNILVNRCGVKIEELSQYCSFDVPQPQGSKEGEKQQQTPPPKSKLKPSDILAKVQEAVAGEYQTEQFVQEQAVQPAVVQTQAEVLEKEEPVASSQGALTVDKDGEQEERAVEEQKEVQEDAQGDDEARAGEALTLNIANPIKEEGMQDTDAIGAPVALQSEGPERKGAEADTVDDGSARLESQDNVAVPAAEVAPAEQQTFHGDAQANDGQANSEAQDEELKTNEVEAVPGGHSELQSDTQPVDQVLEADDELQTDGHSELIQRSTQAHPEAVAQAEGATAEASDLPEEAKAQIDPLTAPAGDDLGIQEAPEDGASSQPVAAKDTNISKSEEISNEETQNQNSEPPLQNQAEININDEKNQNLAFSDDQWKQVEIINENEEINSHVQVDNTDNLDHQDDAHSADLVDKKDKPVESDSADKEMEDKMDNQDKSDKEIDNSDPQKAEELGEEEDLVTEDNQNLSTANEELKTETIDEKIETQDNNEDTAGGPHTDDGDDQKANESNQKEVENLDTGKNKK